MRYDHKKTEKKWQKFWEEKKIFKTELDKTKPKYYILDMFPYVSGSGLHVGHVLGYTATDIIARHKRQKGFNVLHPMGWDSFGLPAEQHAIRTGTHPAVTTEENIINFRRQLKSVGFSYDWDREIGTHESKYYKWTQWIFTKLYEKGMAYEAEMPVNWCPALGTVLANEEVENGVSKEGGHPVERRPLRQWVLKITAYADRLLQDLDQLDWPESLKRLQRNWIGRSEGALVNFQVLVGSEIGGSESSDKKNENRLKHSNPTNQANHTENDHSISVFSSDKKNENRLKHSNPTNQANHTENDHSISVFTTRPDTLFGVSYLVLAPEHPLVEKLTTESHKEAVVDYQKITAAKSDLDRTELNKEKTGVFTGSYAINPVNQKAIPIWVSDYVLMGYGTGAVMAVPSHDERDFEFAHAHKLPVIAVYDPNIEAHPELVPAGLSSDQVRQGVMNGKICWPGEGKCIHSSNDEISINGLPVKEACDKITEWLMTQGFGKKMVNYKIRDWLFSRQRYWGEPFPILHFEDGTKRVLSLDELPLTPPELTDFKPAGDGRSPLAKVKSWVEITDPKTGKKALRETNTMPQWAGSCWYYLRFCDPNNSAEAWSKEAEKYWMPVDMYVGGVEHAVLHLLYARFWHKVLFDCGVVHTLEPFQTLRNQGLIVARSFKNSQNAYVATADVVEKNGAFFHKTTGEELVSQIEKMSKSKLNGVVPDEIIADYGADALRMYEMFMGPLDKEKIWNTDAVMGCSRFLLRFYDAVNSNKVTDEGVDELTGEVTGQVTDELAGENAEAMKLAHRLVHGVGQDIETMQFNTAIAKMMEFMNDFTRLERYPRAALKMLTQALNPFAPHITEEAWEILGGEGLLAYHPWPKVDEKYLAEESVVYIVQVNGKVRGRFTLPIGATKDEVLEFAKGDENVLKFMNGQIPKKMIFVPNKLLNIVVE